MDIVCCKDGVDLLYVGSLEDYVCLVCFNRKTVHILDIYASLINCAEKLLEASYLVGDLDDRNVGEERGEAVFIELFLALCGVVYDKTEQTEFGGISQAERENVDAVVLENAQNLGKASGSVFNKYC